jgi:hypothetical protein
MSSTTAPAALATRRRAVGTAVASAVLQLVVGTVTSVAGIVFSAIEGGGWYAGTVAFAVALPCWWVAGVGLLRGSRRAHVLGTVLLLALFAFDLLKIVYYHESAGYLFCALTILGLALQQAPATRRWVTR